MRGYKNFIKKNNKRLYETEKKSKMIFSLPIYPNLKDSEIKAIIKNLKEIILKF
jgi:dTDP-4-amino-4,6-dideoxygalactose transaminase